MVVVLLSTGATGLRYLFNQSLGYRSPFLFHVLAVAVAAQLTGMVPGLIATCLSVILIDYFFIPPVHSLVVRTPADQISLLLFAAVGIVLSVSGGFRHRAEKRLQSAYDRLALEHEVARLGTFEWFVPEDRIEWSPEMQAIYGIEGTSQTRTHEDWKKLVHPEDLAGALAGIEETVRLKLPTFDQTYRIVRPDGKVRWIHTRRKYQYDAAGKALYVLGINMDITEIKEGEMAQQILSGLLQVCSGCRRVRDAETDSWHSMEDYLRHHGAAKFSHGMCPECGSQWFSEPSAVDEN